MAAPLTVPAALRRAWRNLLAAGPRRLAMTLVALLLALLIARFGWAIPIIGEAELALYDSRELVAVKPTDQDDRILLVAYTDDTLIATRQRSPLDRAMLARALTALDGMGARAIGVDILIDQPQDEDGELTAALKAMKTPTFFAFAREDSNRSSINFNQQNFLTGFLANLKGSQVQAASVHLRTDSDGVIRAWRAVPKGLPPRLVVAMAGAAGEPNAARFADFAGGIRFQRPRGGGQPQSDDRPGSDERPVYTTLPIDLFANSELAGVLASQVKGKYILLGGDISDIDQFETPLTRFSSALVPGGGRTVPGLQVHAQLLAQLLDGFRPAGWSSPTLWAMAFLVVATATLTSMIETNLARIAPFIVLQFLLFGGLPFVAQIYGTDTIGLPAVGWAVAWILAFSSAGSAARAVGAVKRRFAQSALGKYLPRDIAEQIIAEPELLALHGEKREIFALFSDLEGFTKLSHAIEPEMVATLLNRYLDTLSAVVLEHGGVIDKFVGDAVVAFWGAPIARPDDGRNAARAAYAMWQAGEDFRRNAPEGVPPIGKTRVGLHYGEAIVGNFGGEGRIQYTALGDGMNTAARLEAANKPLGSSVMASREAAERSDMDWWRPMGSVVLRGRATPVELFEPAPDFPEKERSILEKILAGAPAHRDENVAALDALVRRHPRDEALAKLLERVATCPNGEAYVLG